MLVECQCYQTMTDKLWWTGGSLSVPCHLSSLPPRSQPHNTAYPTSTTIDCLRQGVYCIMITSHLHFVKADKTSHTQSIPCFSSKSVIGTFRMTIRSSCRFHVLRCNARLFPIVSSYEQVFSSYFSICRMFPLFSFSPELLIPQARFSLPGPHQLY